MPGPLPGAAAAARTIYAGIISSTAIVSIGAYAVRRGLGIVSGAGPLDFVALSLGVGAVLLVLAFRSRLPARSGASDDDWWKANVGRAILVWALLESPAILGAVSLFVTGRLLAYTVLVAMALIGLTTATPSRLSGG
jgi:hypothetical protein